MKNWQRPDARVGEKVLRKIKIAVSGLNKLNTIDRECSERKLMKEKRKKKTMEIENWPTSPLTTVMPGGEQNNKK